MHEGEFTGKTRIPHGYIGMGRFLFEILGWMSVLSRFYSPASDIPFRERGISPAPPYFLRLFRQKQIKKSGYILTKLKFCQSKQYVLF